MARANEQAAVWSILLFVVLRMAQRWYVVQGEVSHDDRGATVGDGDG